MYLIEDHIPSFLASSRRGAAALALGLSNLCRSPKSLASSAAGRLAALALALVVVSGCSPDDVALTAPAPSPQRPVVPGQPSDVVESPTLDRVGVTLTVSGAFRPGLPITVRAHAKANRAASDARIELVVLDADTVPGGDATPRSLGTSKRSMARGDEHDFEAQFLLPRAGYYRIVAITNTTPDGDRIPGDLVILNSNLTTAYLLVDESGGRVSTELDPNVATPTRRPMFGAYGPFVITSSRGATSTRLSESSSLVSASLLPGQWSGQLRYRELDIPGQPLTPASGINVQYECFDPDGQIAGGGGVTTDATGNFTVQCFDDTSGVSVFVQTADGFYATVKERFDKQIAFASDYVQGDFIDLRAAIDHAFRVHFRIEQTIGPKAPTVFGGRTRPHITIKTTNVDNSFTSFYSPSGDYIDLNEQSVFFGYGEFTIPHEYGHAFQYRAIEPWGDGSCYSGPHYVDVANTPYCAFVEGFADFFSGIVGGANQINYAFSDWGWENQNYTDDGWRTEGRVAGFLYDTVDTGAEPDGVSNGPDGDDDHVQLTGKWLADLMQQCSITTSFGIVLTRLTAIDQLIYCMEGDVSAQFLGLGWQTVALAVSPNTPTPTGWSKAAVRATWQWNLYSVGALPCGEASCVSPQGDYISHFTGPGCTGTESYYTPYFTGGTTGVSGNCQPNLATGAVCGTVLRTVTNISARVNGACNDYWPGGNTLSGFVTVYR
jgi:hypothetical protein